MVWYYRMRVDGRRIGIRRHRALKVERLEDRSVLSEFAVMNLNDHPRQPVLCLSRWHWFTPRAPESN
jgi:hypothetical protein